jgi:hypothetical protein
MKPIVNYSEEIGMFVNLKVVFHCIKSNCCTCSYDLMSLSLKSADRSMILSNLERELHYKYDYNIVGGYICISYHICIG